MENVIELATLDDYDEKVRELFPSKPENPYYPQLRGLLGEYFKTHLSNKLSALIRRNLPLYYLEGYSVDYGCGSGDYGMLLNNYFDGGVYVDRSKVLSNLDVPVKYAYDGEIGDFDFDDLINVMESTIIGLPCSLVMFNELLHLAPPWQIKKIMCSARESNIPYIIVTENQATDRNTNLDHRLKKLTSNGQLYEKSYMKQILECCNYSVVETMETKSHYMILAKHRDY